MSENVTVITVGYTDKHVALLLSRYIRDRLFNINSVQPNSLYSTWQITGKVFMLASITTLNSPYLTAASSLQQLNPQTPAQISIKCLLIKESWRNASIQYRYVLC
jgi:hypothetical protein